MLKTVTTKIMLAFGTNFVVNGSLADSAPITYWLGSRTCLSLIILRVVRRLRQFAQ